MLLDKQLFSGSTKHLQDLLGAFFYFISFFLLVNKGLLQ